MMPQTSQPDLPEGQPSQGELLPQRVSLWGWLRRTLASIRYRIILPYVLLTAAVGVIGIYIVTRLVAGTIEERFTNQLLEAARVANDGLVRQERRQLEILRPMEGTIGVPEAIEARDAATLRNLLEVQAYNGNIDSLIVLDSSGEAIIRLDAVRKTNPEVVDSYQFSSGGNYAGLPLVAPILAGYVDQHGDKYAGLVDSPAGPVLYTSTPVTIVSPDATQTQLVGVILVGQTLDRLLTKLKTEALADIVVYAGNGQPVGSTIPDWNEQAQLSVIQIDKDLFNAAATSTQATPLRDIRLLTLFQRDYRAAYAPLVIRGQIVGVISVLLPSNFVITAFATSRTVIVLIFTAAVVMTIVFGLLIGRGIIQPIFELVRLSRAVAQGDLSRRAQVAAEGDEIGILTINFNEMAARLQEYTSALEGENARTQAILGSIADGVLLRDAHGRIILANPAAQRILTTDDGDYDPMRLSTFSIPRDINELARRIDLGDRTISISFAPVNLPDGSYLGDVLVLRDVTSEAMAERTKDNFLNQITHELRTPLTAIKGYADVLRMGFNQLAPDQKERAVETIFTASHTLSQMIDQIVELTAIQTGRLVLEYEPVRLRVVISESLEAWDQKFKDRRIKPRFSQKSADLYVMGDARRLRHALDALFQNAYDFSPEGGALTVTLQPQDSFAVISITDHGVGIASNDMDHIFERFYRGEPTDKHGNLLDIRGMGQGLYVVKAIIEKHDGSIQVESTPRKGSTFHLFIPQAPPDRIKKHGRPEAHAAST